MFYLTSHSTHFIYGYMTGERQREREREREREVGIEVITLFYKLQYHLVHTESDKPSRYILSSEKLQIVS